MNPTATGTADALAPEELSISALIRTATRTAHESAETSTFISRLMAGEMSIAAWQLKLEQLSYVYRALESAADRFRDAGIEPELLDEGLDRSAAIESDLVALRERTGVGPVGILPATAAYVAAIEACGDDVHRFIAHHYTRYLGDLSGGQVMRVKFAEHYGLQAEEGRFFVFDRIEAGPRFKKRYRELLDALTLDEAGRERLVDEANLSFVCNQRIFEELDEFMASETAAA